MAERPCCFAAHVEACSTIAGSEASVPLCRQPATYTAVVVFGPVDGVTLRIDSEVCEKHNRKLSTTPGYQRSIKLRQHAT